jgi:hypothetical protein
LEFAVDFAFELAPGLGEKYELDVSREARLLLGYVIRIGSLGLGLVLVVYVIVSMS